MHARTLASLSSTPARDHLALLDQPRQQHAVAAAQVQHARAGRDEVDDGG